MHIKGRLAPTRRMIAVLFLLFALVFSLLPSTHLPAAQAQQDDTSPYVRAVFDEPRGSSQPYEEVSNPALRPALPVPTVPYQPVAGMTAYIELDALYVIYTNTAAGTLNSTDVRRLKDHANDTARFLWKQSHFKLLLRYTFMVINTHKDISEFTEIFPGAYWLNPIDDDGDGKSVEADLLARGVTANQYDSINYLWAHNNSVVPIAFGGLGGLIEWRFGLTGITENPVFQPSGSETFSTAFSHEIQHTIDFMMEFSGYWEYFHADRPWEYPGAFGEDWSFWEYHMKRWPVENWLGLSPYWGKIRQATDADNDGLPDSGSGLPITEASLGSSAALGDSDNDGAPDFPEANAGMFRNPNLTHPDTDGDLATDDIDPEPLYVINTKILKKNLPLNGNPAGWDLLTSHLEQTNTAFAPAVYANWNSNYLFLMVQVDKFANIQVMIDANADGWFHGKDNYFIAVDPSYPEPTNPYSVYLARIWDSSDSTIATTFFPMWDDDPNYPFGRLITHESIGRYVRPYGSGYLAQIAIPANAQTGLLPGHGKRLGLNITYRDVDFQWGREVANFEKNDITYVTLSDAASNISGSAGMAGVTLTSLGDGATSIVTSNQSGNYALTVAQGWSGTVTPSHPCFNFDPPSRSYNNLTNNQTSQNFTPVFNASSGCANVDVLIGGAAQNSYVLAPQTSLRTSFADVNNGPVKITSANALPLVSAERVIYKVDGVNTSYSEMMGLPNRQLDTTYWLPWYNNKDLDTQLRIGNVSNSTATVRVYIAGAEMPGSPFTIAAGAGTRASFPGVNNGPVKVVSNVKIVASERVIYKVDGVNTSYSETMALPNRQADKIYWLPWYNGVSLDSQLRFANVSTSTATVRVYVAEAEMPGSPFILAPGASTRANFPGVSGGPVKIVSNVNIVASERVIYRANGVNINYSETMALPNRQLDKTYWLPWYNNAELSTALFITNISSRTATVRVYIAGAEMPGSPFTLASGTILGNAFDNNNGPVKIVSNVNILTNVQVTYRVNDIITSYTEIMGLPNRQLDTAYWLPWYNNVDLDTQLRFGIP